MYRVRIPIAIAIFAVLGGVFFLDLRLDTDIGSTALLALLVGTALFEFYTLLGLSSRTRFRAVAAGLFLFGCLYVEEKGLALFPVEPVALGLVLVAVLLVFPRLLWPEAAPFPDRPAPGLPEGTLREAAVISLGLFYVVFLLGYLLRVRLLDVPGASEGQRDGILLVAFVILSAKGADMGGYLVGRRFGRHKILPRVSPKKSFEGTAAGLVLSAGLAAAMAAWVPPLSDLMDPAPAAVFGLVAGALSLAGDLVESAIKRRVGTKDSGRLIPEYGGMLDLLDSLMFASPAGYYFLQHLVARAGAGVTGSGG